MKNILIIKLGALGDFIIILGYMMSIRKKYPDAKITLMTNKAFLSIAKQSGAFDDYIIDNRASYWNFKEQLRILREVLRGGFDYIIDCQANKRTRLKYYPVFRYFMPKTFCWTSLGSGSVVKVEKRSSLSWGTESRTPVEVELVTTDLSFLHGENKYFSELPERFVLFIPGCSPTHPYKRWPVGYFKQLANRLAEQGIHTVVMGTKAEAAEVDAIAQASSMVISMLNKTSLLDIPDLVRRSIAVVGNDTGPSHIAAYSGKPVIAIFDQRTARSITRGPQSINLVSDSTIDLITVDMVWEKLSPFLNPAK